MQVWSLVIVPHGVLQPGVSKHIITWGHDVAAYVGCFILDTDTLHAKEFLCHDICVLSLLLWPSCHASRISDDWQGIRVVSLDLDLAISSLRVFSHFCFCHSLFIVPICLWDSKIHAAVPTSAAGSTIPLFLLPWGYLSSLNDTLMSAVDPGGVD